MSTEESDGGSDNFEILRKCLKTPCTNLLRNILRSKFGRYEDLKEAVPLDTLPERSKSALERQNRISKLNFPVLYDIFRSGGCDRLIGPPAVGWFSTEEIPEDLTGVADDIQRICRIWQKNIKDNEDETISDNESNIAIKTLMDIGLRMSNRTQYKDFGMDFCRELSLASNKEGPYVDAMQLGKKNSIEMSIDSSFNGCVNVIQGGKTNKIIIYDIHDNRVGRIQYKSTGSVQASAVLHSDDPAFQALTERTSELNIEDINGRPALKDNGISIKEIRRGSLVITFTFRNDHTLKENIERVFQCVFEEEKLNEVLRDQNVDKLEFFGYIYDPQEYFLDYVSKESIQVPELGKFHLYTHLTWIFSECTCDIDVVLTDLFHNLLAYDLTTEVNEDIWIMIKGNIIRPTDMVFTSFESLLVENKDAKIEKLNFELEKSGQCKIESINQEKSTTHVVLKTKSCLSYSALLAEDGILFSLLRSFLWSDGSDFLASKVQLMRIGLIIHTKLVQNKEIQQLGHTLIIEFCPESNITKAINNGALPEILTSVLQNSEIEVPERMKIKVDINDQRTSAEKEGQSNDLTRVAVSERLDRAELMLKGNEFDETKQLAREVFDGSHLDIESTQRLMSIFEKCADDFYSLKCFCIDRVLRKKEWTTENLSTAKEYWMRVIRGPYTVKSIMNLFLDIELLLFEYLKKKEYSASVQGICYELGMSYRHLRSERQSQFDITEIDHRLNIIDWRICSKLLEEGSYEVVCETYEKRAQESKLDAENLYLWAKSLKKLKKYEASLKKVDEAISLDRFSTSEKTRQELFQLKEDLTKLENQVEKSWKFDENWLEEHNTVLEHQQKRTSVIQPNEEDRESGDYDTVWPSKSEEVLKKIENLKIKDASKPHREDSGHDPLCTTGGQGKGKDSIGSVKDRVRQLEQKSCDIKVRPIQTQEHDMPRAAMRPVPIKREIDRMPPKPKPRLSKRKSNEEQRMEVELKDEIYAEIDDEENNKRSEYKYVAAIDIGTTYSGYAFSSHNHFDSNPLDIITPRWNDGLFLSLKTSTCALYNEKGEFDCFGYEADNKYYDMTLNDPDLVEHCLKFTNFKMKLYDTRGSLEGLVLNADQGGTMPALLVFSDVILHLKNKIISDIRQIKSDVIDDDVRWVLTVPAIWNDEARKFMIRAAVKAGIHADDLVLCLEPEAAAVMCKELQVQKYIQTKSDSILAFMLGTKFVVVDLGGGTVDITTNEVLQNGMIRELKCCRGSNCGGTYVDNHFWDFIRNVLDYDFETLSKAYRTDMHDLRRSFEIKKRQVDSQKSKYVMLQIPSIIAQKIKSDKLSKDNVTLVRDKLKFPITVFQEFFASSISRILNCLREVVTDEIHSILLVGGYAGCKEIRQVIRQTYPSHRLVCPPESDLAVVKGAVIFGHNPAVISSRISKMWYGIQTSPDISPINKIYEGNFYPVTKKGQPIKIGENVHHKFYISEKFRDKFLNLRQVSSPSDKMPVNVEEETNCIVSELRIPIPVHQEHMKRILTISVKFKGTEFVYAAFVTLKASSPTKCVVKVT